jgi:hypothetical protein
MWRYVIAAFFAAHGFAHLVGFEGTWGVGAFEGKAKAPALLSEISTDSATLKLFGILWLIGLLAFAVAAAGVVFKTRWAPTATAGAALFSLVISLVSWPDAWIGVVINVAILAVLAGIVLMPRRAARAA